MIVQIIKSSNPGFWYAGLVGQNFTVEDVAIIDTDKVEKFTVVPTPNTDPLFLINCEDCKVLSNSMATAILVCDAAIQGVINEMRARLEKMS